MLIHNPDHAKLWRQRTTQFFTLAAICSGLLVPSLATAQQTGDARRGFVYAQRQCSDCHAVQAGKILSPLVGVATFKESGVP